MLCILELRATWQSILADASHSQRSFIGLVIGRRPTATQPSLIWEPGVSELSGRGCDIPDSHLAAQFA